MACKQYVIVNISLCATLYVATFVSTLRTDSDVSELTQKVGNARLVTDCLAFGRYNDLQNQLYQWHNGLLRAVDQYLL